MIFFLKYVEHAACKLAESTDSLKIELKLKKKNLPKCVPLICKYWGGGEKQLFPVLAEFLQYQTCWPQMKSMCTTKSFCFQM